MALEDTIFIAKSAGDCVGGGVLVAQNASYLAAELDAEAVEWSLKVSCFSEGDTVWIGEEKILVGSGNNITRAQGGTSGAVHPNTSAVILDTPTSVLSKTFDGDETPTIIRGNGLAPGMWGIKVNGTLQTPVFSTGYHQEFFYPWSGSSPLVSETVEIVVWNFYPEAVYWAAILP